MCQASKAAWQLIKKNRTSSYLKNRYLHKAIPPKPVHKIEEVTTNYVSTSGMLVYLTLVRIG